MEGRSCSSRVVAARPARHVSGDRARRGDRSTSAASGRPLFDAAILTLAGAFLILTGPVVGSSIGDGIRQITTSVGQTIAGQLGSGQIELPSGPRAVGGAEPVVNGPARLHS